MAYSQTRSFLSDFKDFIMKGNVVDLAVAVVIGGAFGKIVTSLIEDVITPAVLNPAMKAAKVENLAQLQFNGIKYGSFLASILSFLVISFVIFILVRALEAAKRKQARNEAIAEAEAPDPAVVAQEQLISSLNRLADVVESKTP